MTDLILVRHGETNENSAGILQGQTEGTLSENGIKQNRLLANRLKGLSFDVIFTSPLIRAVETGKEILKFHNNIQLLEDVRLIERNMGILQGRKIPESYDLNNEVEGMESLQSVFLRAQSFLEYALKYYNNRSVLIVSHGITLIVITGIIKGIPTNEINNIKLLDNSTYAMYKITQNALNSFKNKK